MQLGLHVIAKPIGPVCNLRCAYCFYLEKESLYPAGEQWRMSDETLDAFVRQYIEAQPEGVDRIDFAFQGGEPTLMGIDFFRRLVELQVKYARSGLRIQNSLQTNGVLLDDRWCEFLRRHNFLVGLSLDGPAELHDKYRVDRQGRGTFEPVMAALERLKRHGVEFNVLCCVTRHNGGRPQRVYRFFRDCGAQFVQFIPIVQRATTAGETGDQRSRQEGSGFGDEGSGFGVQGSALDDQPSTLNPQPSSLVSPRSVLPEQFGRFLVGVFDEWVRRDVGRVFVRDFDQALAAWVGAGASLCVYAEQCGRAVALEHNGDLYRCDHFVTPQDKLGNIHQTPIAELADSRGQLQFGRDKSERLADCCRRCEFRFACNGACPKDRFLPTPDGQPGLNFLCRGYKAFFRHVDPYMQAMAAELRAGRPADGVMRRLRAEKERARQSAATGGSVRRNDPCPCGSGRKYKHCCMRG